MANKELIIDSGLCTYEIKDADGRSFGSFTFNPSDTDIIKRYEKVAKTLENLEILDPAEGENPFKELDQVIYKEIDYLLNGNVSEAFFSIMGPFSPLASGQLFVESVIDAIGQAIQAETGERMKKIAGKISKHTAKYHG